MNLIPQEELERQGTLNLAPMIDFLFIVVAVFAVIGISHMALYDSEIDLIHTTSSDMQIDREEDIHLVDLSITENGTYKWLSELKDYSITHASLVGEELLHQQTLGILPAEKEKTKVLIHIDENAEWGPIAKLIFAIREAGFRAHPVYEIQE